MFVTRESVGQLQGFKNFLNSGKITITVYFVWSGIHLMMKRVFIGFRLDLIYISELSIVNKYIIKQIIPHKVINDVTFYVILVTLIVLQSLEVSCAVQMCLVIHFQDL